MLRFGILDIFSASQVVAETLLPGAWGSWIASLLGEKYVNGYNTKFPLLLYHIMNLIQGTS